MNTIVVCSGVLDSVTLAHKVAAERIPFHLAGIDDPAPYQDPDFWGEACRPHRASELS